MGSRSEAVAVAFRIGTQAHALLDGSGAAASDTARWTSRGRHAIYAAEHYATALLEKAAQLNSLRLPRTLVFIRIEIPQGTTVEEVTPGALPRWDANDRAASQQYGNRWYDERRSLILLVPSLVAPGLERNVVINQRHPEFPSLATSVAERVRCHPQLLA